MGTGIVNFTYKYFILDSYPRARVLLKSVEMSQNKERLFRRNRMSHKDGESLSWKPIEN